MTETNYGDYQPHEARSEETYKQRHERLLAEIAVLERQAREFTTRGVSNDDPALSFLLGRLDSKGEELISIVAARTAEQFEA